MSELVLRDYQDKALEDIKRYFRNKPSRVLLQMPTGSGKTAIFCWILRYCAQNNRPCIMTVRGRSLVDQASQRLAAMGVDHSVFMAGDKRFDESKPVQIASIDTCIARQRFPKANTVIIDEAHMAVSDSFKDFLSNYESSNWLSVTATPWAKDGLKHIADHVVYPISFDDLIKSGRLVRPRYFVPNSFDSSQIAIGKGEFLDSQSIFQIQSQNIHGHIIDNYKKNCVGDRTFVFAVNIAHANMIAEEFKKSGIDSVVVTAETSLGDRSGILKTCDLIISVGTLTTGVDVPDLKNIIIARPTQSKNLYIQMLGRGTRPYPGKEFFTVYDHVGNVARHGFIEDEEKADLEPQKKKKSSQVLEAPIKVCPSCMAVMHAAAKFCPECEEKMPEKEMKIKGTGELEELKTTTKDERELLVFQTRMKKYFQDAFNNGNRLGSAGYRYAKLKDGEKLMQKYRIQYFKLLTEYRKKFNCQ